ncbi:MAG TPA: sulfotransferase [Chromatiales bacterium]|jgi:hypothetical protein|nr:sulfotransferase [Chromatiales bacterium]HIO14905.1 sulfotransferase [Chromatiales bacterium]
MSGPPSLQDLITAVNQVAGNFSAAESRACFRDPVIIVSAPRAGSTLLFELMSQAKGLWTVGGESHPVFMTQPHLRAENASFDSGRLTKAHAEGETAHKIRAGFLTLLVDRDRKRYMTMDPSARPSAFRFLEKTPRNALNIPFLCEVFPDARFIFLHRDPRENIASIMEAWTAGRQGGFVTFPGLSGWKRGDWCLLLPPGWRELNDASIAEIAAFQWRRSNEIILDDLQNLPESRWMSLSYSDLIASPKASMERICGFCDLSIDDRLAGLVAERLPLSSTTMTPPDPDKWRKHEAEIMAVLPTLGSLISRLEIA